MGTDFCRCAAKDKCERHKLQQRKFQLDISTKLLTMGLVNSQGQVAQKSCGISVGDAQKRLGVWPCTHLEAGSVLSGDLEQVTSKGPLQSKLFSNS